MPTTPFPVIETKRLLLREIVHDDASALFAVRGNPEAMKWFGEDPLPDEAAARTLIDIMAGWRSKPSPPTRWGIHVKGQNALAGSCGLFARSPSWRKCSLSYELNPEVQGNGYMHEALCACLTWGFENMELNRIEAVVHPCNAASLRTLQRLGFKQEGLLRQVGFWRGHHHDMYQYSLLRQEFPQVGKEVLT